ncbi:3-oxoacyl-reductase [Blyttiomyces helicus]|uniref:3-oxoacyl-reductase n=1 Tax=Blyttiomyces helicus TaxID=388810 RepID=A0A4P9WRC2_9FUNG|nr:3-oxoacyl-reductase [Blyttiomyces helicus]|eukprot:RKO93446.1 3-oxoacyl-reductase [Blyttiomyces helicus]
MSAAKDLSGRVALVTGASRGIGKAIAAELAGRGADVVITYSSDKSAVEAAASVAVFKELGVRALHVQSDVGSIEAGKKLLDYIKREFGKIDIIVNNAGVIPTSAIESEYDRTFDINTKGVFFLVTSAINLGLLQDHGRIINITTVGSRLGMPKTGIVSASKAALEAISRSWASELGPRNITSNSVAPGPVDTGIFETLASGEALKAMKDAMIGNTPLGRLGEVTDISNIVGFLASPASQWITGQTIQASGGMSKSI